MSKLITLRQASEQTGLSVTTLRRKVIAGTIPALRTHARTGRILFVENLLMQCLRNEAISNLKTSKGFEEDQEIDSSFAPEGEVPLSMANAHMLFGTVTQEDIDAGRFGADQFVCKPTLKPTSETLSIEKPLKKP